jgi:hypothetical protein
MPAYRAQSIGMRCSISRPYPGGLREQKSDFRSGSASEIGRAKVNYEFVFSWVTAEERAELSAFESLVERSVNSCVREYVLAERSGLEQTANVSTAR